MRASVLLPLLSITAFTQPAYAQQSPQRLITLLPKPQDPNPGWWALPAGDTLRVRRCVRIHCRMHRRFEYMFEVRNGWGPIATLRLARHRTLEPGIGIAWHF